MSGKKRFDVTGFGESMLRLSVPAGSRLTQMRALEVHLAGAESNVLAALACLERRCGWVGGLPEGEIGHFVQRTLRAAAVDAQPILVPGSRLGTYFVEFAGIPRATTVLYDRAHSAITTLQPDQIPYEFLLDTRLLHLTGITPALAPGCLDIVRQLLTRARAAGVAVSFDINYRSKLWPPEEAAATLLPLAQRVDLLLCSQRDAANLFGCTGSAEQIIDQLAAQTQARQIVVTLGDAGVAGWDGTAIAYESARPVAIIDSIGAGDALAAGVIHGWLAGDLALGLRYGTLLAALALSQQGDMLVTSPDEVAALLRDDGAASGDRRLNR